MALRLQATLKTFLDRKAVIDAVDRAELRVLSKMGAFVMRTDRKSIKERPTVSPPGRPPHAHSVYYRPAKPPKAGAKPRKRPQKPKKRLRFKDSILFGYDAARKSVVIGPYLFDRPSRPTVPELLEVGGRNPATGETYKARPHTLPAFEKEKRDGLPRILRDCVSR